MPEPDAHLTSGADNGQATPADPLLQVRNLSKHFPIYKGLFRRQVGVIKAIDDVSFDAFQGETLGLVGESGCGKSTTGRAVLRLYDVTAGNITLEGKDITNLRADELRQMRPRTQMIFQDPQASLNPRMTVGSIIAEPLDEHRALTRAERREQLFTDHGIPLVVNELERAIDELHQLLFRYEPPQLLGDLFADRLTERLARVISELHIGSLELVGAEREPELLCFAVKLEGRRAAQVNLEDLFSLDQHAYHDAQHTALAIDDPFEVIELKTDRDLHADSGLEL